MVELPELSWRISRRNAIKLAALAGLTFIAYKTLLQALVPIEPESNPKNEVEMNTAVTVRVGNEYFKYYGFSSLVVSDNTFEMGKKINPASVKEVYKEVDGIVGGPISSVKFASSNLEACSFNVEEGKFNLKSIVPIPYSRYTPFVKGLLTVFNREKNDEITSKIFLVGIPGPREENKFGDDGVSISRAWQILENGQIIKMPNGRKYEALLGKEQQGDDPMTIAYLLENYSRNTSIPNNIY